MQAKRPEIVIGADIIAGFPTETDTMFANSIDLVRRCRIVHGHIFPYSPKAGTPAALMPQVPAKAIKYRARALREAVALERDGWLASLIGSIQNVAVEMGGVAGHAENFAYVKFDRSAVEGSIVAARVTKYKDQQLHAEILA